jgi:hypothetical protein
MFTAFNSTTNKLSPTYVDTVRELGGHVLETKFFHPRCTHVVMAEPVRTEKSLAACAAGIWYPRTSCFPSDSRHSSAHNKPVCVVCVVCVCVCGACALPGC